MIYHALGNVGLGKTAWASLYAKQFSELNPNSNIYANYHLNLKNFVYTPFMFLPFSKLDKALIIADDFYALKNVKGFTATCVNLSRKASLDIILTGQYYTMIPKEIRTLSNEVRPFLDKITEKLYSVIMTPDNECSNYVIKDVFTKMKGLYNTNEIVKFNRLDNIADEIIKHSNDLDDLLNNIELYAQSQTKTNQMLKLIKSIPKSSRFFQ